MSSESLVSEHNLNQTSMHKLKVMVNTSNTIKLYLKLCTLWYKLDNIWHTGFMPNSNESLVPGE